jgi:thioredoxin-related protein
MMERRAILRGALALAGGLALPPARRAKGAEAYAPRLNDDGLYEQPWFLQSFLDLPEDLAAARDAGKRLAIIWELKGCPYCKETHLVNFAQQEIRDFVRQNFDMLQLNMIGSRTVTDFDGEVVEERSLARKWGVRFSPTVCFYPDAPEAGRPGHEIEVARMPGYFRPPHFLAMFRFVREKAYETGDFRSYLKASVSG